MKSAKLVCVALTTLLAALALPVPLAAQHTRYKLIDLGTFGGPASSFNAGGRMLNSRGFGVGASEMSTPDPPDANGFPCGPGIFIYHAFELRNGVVTNLGALDVPDPPLWAAVAAAGITSGGAERADRYPACPKDESEFTGAYSAIAAGTAALHCHVP